MGVLHRLGFEPAESARKRILGHVRVGTRCVHCDHHRLHTIRTKSLILLQLKQHDDCCHASRVEHTDDAHTRGELSVARPRRAASNSKEATGPSERKAEHFLAFAGIAAMCICIRRPAGWTGPGVL